MSEFACGARVVAVVPALDEAPAIAGVVSALRAHPLIDRVVVVDNGSRDGTGDIARGAGAEVVREDRRGYGHACLAGVRAATAAEVVVLLDADAADDPADIAALVGPVLRDEADLVVGSRVLGSCEPGAMAPAQRAGNRVATVLMRALCGARVTDLGPLRAIRPRDLLRLGMAERTYGWSTEMMVKALRAGLRYREVPVSYRRRVGESKVSGTLAGSVAAGWCILRSVVRYARWRPSEAGPRVYVAARAPRLGLNKTRLADTIGERAALELYRGFLADLAARLRGAGIPIGWYVTPHDAWDEIAEVVGPAPRPEPVVVQPEGDWTERQRALLEGAPARGEAAVVLIASDSPQLGSDVVARALALLDDHDLVLGPVDDGGYYLIGVRGRHDVLAGIPMSVPGVTERILAKAGRSGLSSALVETTFDVDVAGDLPALAEAVAGRSDMPATRRALAAVSATPAAA